MADSTSSLTIFSPEPAPNEFSSALLSIFDSETVNHDYVKQLVYSLATRTADPMLQYLCSGATYFPNSVIGFSALIAALIPLELNSQIQHLQTFIGVLPKIFTRTVTSIGNLLDSMKLEIPQSLQDLRASLANPVQNVKQTLQYLIVYYNIEQFVKDQKEAYTEALLNSVRVCVAWILSIASYLRLNTLALATSSTATLTRVGKIDDDLIPSIHSSFVTVNTFSPSTLDISYVQPLLQSSAIIITTLSTYLDKISSEPDHAQIQSYQNEALSYMNLLQGTLDQIRGIPADVAQQDARIFIQNLYSTVDYFGKSLSQQPEMFSSLQSDLKIQAFVAFLLFDVLKAADTTKMKKLFTQFYAIDNLPGILQKSQEIQNEMQVVNNELYGFGSQQNKETKAQEEKSNVIKKTTIEEVQVIKTVSEKPKRIQHTIPEKPPEPIKPQGPVIDPPRDIDQIYYTLDFHDTPMLTNALALITCQEAREATISDINDFLNNPELASDRAKLEDSVRKVLIMRAENKYLLDVAAIAQFDENTCMEKSLDIAAVMPLYAGKEQKAVHQHSLPLFLQKSSAEVYSAVRTLLSYITYIVPLRQRVDQIATIILKEARSVDQEIQETVNIFQIPSRSPGNTDRERDIFDLATFLSYADIMQCGEFYETNVEVWINQLRSHITMEKTRNIAMDMVVSCIATATARRCFDPAVMRSCRASLEALDQYLSQQTEQARLRLIGCLCLIPVQFNPEGQMDVPWASALALITPTALNELFSINSSSLTSHLIHTYSVQTAEDVERSKAKSESEAKGLMAQLSSSSSDDDDEPEIIYEDIIEEEEVGEPETIEEVEEITIEEEEDETEDESQMVNQVHQARTLEAVRNALHLLKSFNDAAINLEPAIVNARFQSLYLAMYDLTQLVSPEEAGQITQQLQNITAIAKQIVGYNDRSQVSQLQVSIDYLKQLKHSFTKKSSSSVVLSELVLLNSYSDQLYSLVEYDPNEVEINNKEPLKKEVITESKDVLKLIRQLGKRSIKLIQQTNDIPHSKPLVKAIAQTSESVQLFYLYIRCTENSDDVLRSVVSNGCRKMESALSCMVMLLPKTLVDEYNEIRTINNDIVSHLEYMVDLSEQKGGTVASKAQGSAGSIQESGNELTEKRLNAEALVIKRRKELSDAEAEVQRLKDA